MTKAENPPQFSANYYDQAQKLHFVALQERIRSGQIYGEVGKMEFSPDGEKVQCHLCGKLLKLISTTHLHAHGLENGDDYRELLGLKKGQPLCSPVYSRQRSEQVIRQGNANHFIGKGLPFKRGKDERREEKTSIQERRERGEVRVRHRKERKVIRGTKSKEPNTRLIHAGHFKIYDVQYFFSKKANGWSVEISVFEDQIVAKGELADGTVLIRYYDRER